MDTIALQPDPTKPGYWDLYLDANNNIAVNTDGQALAQDAASAIKTFQGEVYYDTTLGIPYWSTILGKLPPLALIKSLFINAALAVPGVVSARCFMTSFTGRTFSGQVQVTDKNGNTTGAFF